MKSKIGQRLKDLRKSKGMTQEQVADYLSISQSSYARIENGESQSWVNYLDKICELFKIEIEDLLKKDKVIINNNQQGGVGYAETINNLSEKLVEQYEERIKELKEIISQLKK